MTATASLQLGSTDMIARLQKFAKQAPDLAARKIPSAARRVTRFAKRIMPQATPPPVAKSAYPLMWTTERQRRAFFATNGFGGGIPYKRKGRLMESWVIRTDLDAGIFVMINTAPQAPYVIGADQQGYLRMIGWPNIESDNVAQVNQVAAFAANEIGVLHNSLVDDWLRAAKAA